MLTIVEHTGHSVRMLHQSQIQEICFAEYSSLKKRESTGRHGFNHLAVLLVQ